MKEWKESYFHCRGAIGSANMSSILDDFWSSVLDVFRRGQQDQKISLDLANKAIADFMVAASCEPPSSELNNQAIVRFAKRVKARPWDSARATDFMVNTLFTPHSNEPDNQAVLDFLKSVKDQPKIPDRSSTPKGQALAYKL